MLKFVGTSVCSSLADFLSRLTAFRLGVESSNQDGAYSAKTETCFVGKYVMFCSRDYHDDSSLVEVRASPDKLSCSTAQGPTRRFEI